MTILLLLITILLVLTITLLIIENLLFQPFKGTATKWLHHSDLNGRKVLFKSRRNELSGWFYGEDNDDAKGLIIISHAMGVTSEYYLPEIMYFADRGYKVFAFDNTGYGYNKGLFWGFPQAVKDLKSAIIYADDHTLPIILFGHSMGGYAVSTVLADPEVKSHNISGVIEYSGFNDIKDVVRDFLGADNSLLKKFMAELICLGQFLIFGRMIYNKASDVVNANSDVNFIMVHGTKDEEVRIGSTALISRDFANTNVRKIIAYNEGVNTHMGVIRNDNGSKPEVNQEILDEIIDFLD